MAGTKKTGSFGGKSNALGHGGRAAQLKAQGVPGGVIGEIARKKGAAPGQKNYHGGEGRSGARDGMGSGKGGLAVHSSAKGAGMHGDSRTMRHERY